MDEKYLCRLAEEALGQFDLGMELLQVKLYGSGHINDTFLVEFKQEDNSKKYYILQRMNDQIFGNTEALMENLVNVTSFLRKKILLQGGNPDRETLNVILTKNQDRYYRDSENFCWRVLNFIEDAVSYDRVTDEAVFYESAVAFGNFQYLLSDYPAETLHEIIPDFHNTEKRFKALKEAAEKDVCGRKKEVEDELNFAYQREEIAPVLYDLMRSKEIPVRVTHNDTKLNNVMMDKETGKGICVVDLDTVMPGSAVLDFGDAIRFGANKADEDEQDLSKVSCDLDLFRIYTKGYLEGCKGSLTENEIKLLPLGAKLITYENGMRFLTDYLQGDVYYKTHREKQNLDRCRTQFKLVQDMEEKWDQMEDIVRKFL